MAAPEFLEAIGKSQIKLRLHKATEKYGPVTYYYLIVVTEEVSKHMDPDDINIEEVGI